MTLSFRQIAALFLAAMAIKLCLIGSLISPLKTVWVERFELSKGYDDVEYYEIARQMVKYDGLMFPKGDQLQIYRTPVYPFFLAILGVLCKWQPLGMLVAQAALLSLAPVLLAFLLRRAEYPPGFAWLLAIDPISNILGVSFMTEGLFAIFLLAGFFFLLRAGQLLQRGLALAAFSLAVLVKPSAQFFYVGLCLYLLLRFRPRTRTLLVILLSALPLLGWMARNAQVAGLFVVSTQTDNSIMLPETIRALEENAPARQLIGHICKNWAGEHGGGSIYASIMDNKLDFSGVATAYILQHPVLFAKYHLLGMARVLFGTCRAHVAMVFPVSTKWSTAGWSVFNLVLAGFYGLFYLALLLTWRWRSFRHSTIWLSWLFVLYNVALIGVLAYTTGGGLKRAPFVPFLIIALAGQWHSLYGKHAAGPAGPAVRDAGVDLLP